MTVSSIQKCSTEKIRITVSVNMPGFQKCSHIPHAVICIHICILASQLKYALFDHLNYLISLVQIAPTNIFLINFHMMATLNSWECPTGVTLGHTASTIGPAHFHCPDGHMFVCMHLCMYGRLVVRRLQETHVVVYIN